MSVACPSCGHFTIHGPGDRPCTQYVESLGAECGCPGVQRTGLDDGPPLPSQAARDRACANILASQPIADNDRLNWLEKRKYFEVGIGYDGSSRKFAYEVRFKDRELKRYFGKSLREAIDNAIRSEAA